MGRDLDRTHRECLLPDDMKLEKFIRCEVHPNRQLDQTTREGEAL